MTTPEGLTEIKPNAFSGCTNISAVTLNEDLETIGNNAFVKCAFTTFTVPSTVLSVGDSMLGGCANLTELTIPYTGSNADATLTYGAQNFGYIFGTTDYDSGTDNDYFTECASENAVGSAMRYQIPNALKTVYFNSNLTTIKSYVFRNCITLETISLPSSVTTILDNAFYGCTSLSSVTLRSETVVTNIAASGLFSSGVTIYVPSALLSSYQIAYAASSSLFAAITE